MSGAKKIVLIASREYQPSDEALLRNFYWRKIDLFCATGPYSNGWELAMDLVCTDPSNQFDHHIITTSHGDEPLSDVINMAELWFVEDGSEVEIVEL